MKALAFIITLILDVLVAPVVVTVQTRGKLPVASTQDGMYRAAF